MTSSLPEISGKHHLTKLLSLDTNYVRNAIVFQLPYLDSEERELSSTQCSKCKTITEQEWIKIIPVSDEPLEGPDAIEFMKNVKRLIVCTKCGTLRLTT